MATQHKTVQRLTTDAAALQVGAIWSSCDPTTQRHMRKRGQNLRECGTAQPCHPRTWNLKNEHDFSVAHCGFCESLSGSEWLFVAFFEWLDSGLKWLGVARQWPSVARSGSKAAFSGSKWLDSGFFIFFLKKKT